MKQLLFGCGLTVFVFATSGCQCSGLTERYADVIDDVADSSPRFDCLYTPCLDLTRIGKPDWCQCRFSGLLCRRGCRDGSWGSGCPNCGRYYPASWTTSPGISTPQILPDDEARPVMPTPEAPPAPSPDPNAPPAPMPELKPPTIAPAEPVLNLDE